jgi:hypothetical protein
MKEKYIWFIALAVFVLMGLFPPWENSVHPSFVGYSFIGNPPTWLCDYVKLSLSHLLAEWAIVWGVAGVLIYLKRKTCREVIMSKEGSLNWRRGFFRFTIVVSLVIGLCIFGFSFETQTTNEISTLAERRAATVKTWKWFPESPTRPSAGKWVSKLRESPTRPPARQLEEALEKDETEKKEMKKEEIEYKEIKSQALQDLHTSDAIKSNPRIILLCLLIAFIGFLATWIFYGTLYFVITGFTGKGKRMEQ